MHRKVLRRTYPLLDRFPWRGRGVTGDVKPLPAPRAGGPWVGLEERCLDLQRLGVPEWRPFPIRTKARGADTRRGARRSRDYGGRPGCADEPATSPCGWRLRDAQALRANRPCGSVPGRLGIGPPRDTTATSSGWGMVGGHRWLVLPLLPPRRKPRAVCIMASCEEAADATYSGEEREPLPIPAIEGVMRQIGTYGEVVARGRNTAVRTQRRCSAVWTL